MQSRLQDQVAAAAVKGEEAAVRRRRRHSPQLRAPKPHHHSPLLRAPKSHRHNRRRMLTPGRPRNAKPATQRGFTARSTSRPPRSCCRPFLKSTAGRSWCGSSPTAQTTTPCACGTRASRRTISSPGCPTVRASGGSTRSPGATRPSWSTSSSSSSARSPDGPSVL